MGVQGLIERASPALTAAYCLSRACTNNTPVLASSGRYHRQTDRRLLAGWLAGELAHPSLPPSGVCLLSVRPSWGVVVGLSGMTEVTAPMALAAGAKGVGVGAAGEEEQEGLPTVG